MQPCILTPAGDGRTLLPSTTKEGASMDTRYLHDKEELKQSTQTVDEERRAFLTAGLVGGAVAAGTLGRRRRAGPASGAAPALSDKPWWPHPKWGKDDQAGASNWITPAKVLDAVKIDQGRQDLPYRPRLRSGDAQVRRARLHPAHPGSADRRPVRRQQARLSRRVPRHRDRPDRHAVRRAGPHRHPDGQGRRQERDALLQRRHRAGDRSTPTA